MDMNPPGTLITANAGCGKTFSLANRVLGWLVLQYRASGNAGVREILAATFTRKAAGEIQQRILRHLAFGATDPDRLQIYRETIDIEPPPTGDELLEVLAQVAKDIDRMQVNTLDGVFHNLARAVPEAVGLPQGWTIADQPAMAALQRETIDAWLQSCDDAQISALAEAAEGEVLRGAMHRAVRKAIWGESRSDGLIDLWRRSTLVPAQVDPWEWFANLQDDHICPDCARLPEAALAEAACVLRATDVPVTKAGTPHKSWIKARDRVADKADTGRWSELLTDSFVGPAIEGGKFSSQQMPASMTKAIRPLVAHARQLLVDRLRVRHRVWRALLSALSSEWAQQQRSAGLYAFADVADRLARADLLTPSGLETLAWRLDSRIRDVALDEFQDTSIEQARVLAPLVEELLSGEGAWEVPRHLLVVADRKQSIYGWRGGTPELINWLIDRGGPALQQDTLGLSRRSSPVLMDFINLCFQDLDTNIALLGEAQRRPQPPAALVQACGLDPEVATSNAVDLVRARWVYSLHASAFTPEERPGQVCAWSSTKDDLIETIVKIVRRRLRVTDSIGVLCPSNENDRAVSEALREAGVSVSQEGRGDVEAIPAARVLLDMLRLGQHPTHSLAAYHVSHSPLGRCVDLPPIETLDDAPQRIASASHAIRSRISSCGLVDALSGWVESIAADISNREIAALRHVVMLAADWDDGRPRPCTDFVEHVLECGVGDAAGGNVRVMTLHASKGLEFGEVVLGWLDDKFVKEEPPVVQGWSSEPLGAVSAVAPGVSAAERAHAPILHAFHEQAYAGDLADRLSLLYVGLTRAKQGLHVVFRPGEKELDATLSPSTLLRAAIPELDQALSDVDDTHPVPVWQSPGSNQPDKIETPTTSKSSLPSAVTLQTEDPAERVTPSTHETPLEMRMQLLPGRARRHGVILHELFRAVQWLDDGKPDQAAIDQAFAEAAIQLGRPVPVDQQRALLERFDQALDGNVGQALRREAHAAWGDLALEVLPEHPLLATLDDGVIRGRIDRLVLGRDADGRVVHALILDYKSGGVSDDDQLQALYGEQMHRYAQGVAATWGLPESQVETRLIHVA